MADVHTADDWIRDLCREIPALYAELGAELGAQLDGPDQSTPKSAAPSWCLTHGQAHPDDRWDWEATYEPETQSWTGTRCQARLGYADAGHLIGATVTATPTRGEHVARSGAPGSGAPDHALVWLGAQSDLWTTVDDLLMRLREARQLPHPECSPMPAGNSPKELGRRCGLVLPLLDALSQDQRRARWLTIALGRLRGAHVRALAALGEIGPTQILGLCPVVQEPYPGAWDAAGTVVTAWWEDGQCRRYDYAASVEAGQDLWVRSVLRVDPRAAVATRESDVRCPGCGVRWSGEDGRRQLGRLLGGLGPDPATAVQIERWHGIPASTIRNWVSEGALSGDGHRPMRFAVADALAIRDRRQGGVTA
ncbi:hypothetical protein I6A60_01850 [Frankia sp. AgB1.9]|uniref:hypothetical protein n=1 Tax=unclassified Frankia TaxID=2632575 RepID=UPI0019315E2B|nr:MULTISPECIES: hypothetical protein [unclassified Frankia]MBL7494457.1 hypothetical protein [Frankia sp. AgW1.1]MBL7546629.1 hypothetical protein [Frankia sp. AgB1.9]MBL7622385.1 hypothetical protein [Frankia sp. AgB1.8]